MLSPFQQVDDSQPTLGGLMPPLISFVVAGITARDLLPVVASSQQRGDVYTAVIYLALQLTATILAGRFAFMLFKPSPYVPVWASLCRFAVAGAWLAPAMILARLGPWWGVAGGGVVAVMLAKCLRDFQLSPANEEASDEYPGACMRFGFTAAMALQAGLVALWIGYFTFALLLTGLGWFIIALQTSWRTTRQTNREFAASLLLALVLVICGFVLSHPKAGSSSIASPVARAAAPKNLHSGVILLTEPKRYLLTLPVALLHKRGPTRQVNNSIPFSGEYWFYYSLFRLGGGKRVVIKQRPPASSAVIHGDPTSWVFTNEDRGLRQFLVMKAHQPLERPVDLSCCGRIDVEVTSNDSPAGHRFDGIDPARFKVGTGRREIAIAWRSRHATAIAQSDA
jgi:hypothetical protein